MATGKRAGPRGRAAHVSRRAERSTCDVERRVPPSRAAAPGIQPARRSGRSGASTPQPAAARPSPLSTRGEPHSVRGAIRSSAPAAGRGAQLRRAAAPRRSSQRAAPGAAGSRGAARSAGAPSRCDRRDGAAPSCRAPPPQPASTADGEQRRRAALTPTTAPASRRRRERGLRSGVEPDAPEQLVGEREVVGAEVGPVVEDRARPLGRLGVGDRRRITVSKTLSPKCSFSWRRPRASARCACRRCSARTPSHSRSGL